MRVTLVVHEHERLGRGIELAMPAEELKANDVALEFLTGELKGSHDLSGIVFTVLAAMSGMEREDFRDRTLEGHESARERGKTIDGAGVTDESMLSMALHLRDQEMSLRDIAKRLVITTGAKKGRYPPGRTDPLRGDRTLGQKGELGEEGTVEGLVGGLDLDGDEQMPGARRARVDRFVELLDVAEVQPGQAALARLGAYLHPAQRSPVRPDDAIPPEQLEDPVIDPHMDAVVLEDL
ncbi:recombinase family protein [Streptomyces fulvoviolaceus]|uniref:recombinase family protein n=1 Tax=Streptomyces fulvoviolaceus TaxID=285535 RepID=UPI000996FA58|nr:recombinase family protein [Streptomyces fulvoviolaceus]